MMKKQIPGFLFLLLNIICLQIPSATGQNRSADQGISRPKMVIGMVVDQMRYDYLYRYYDKYGDGGIKRMLREGFNCNNHHYPYSNTSTGAGHASI